LSRCCSIFNVRARSIGLTLFPLPSSGFASILHFLPFVNTFFGFFLSFFNFPYFPTPETGFFMPILFLVFIIICRRFVCVIANTENFTVKICNLLQILCFFGFYPVFYRFKKSGSHNFYYVILWYVFWHGKL